MSTLPLDDSEEMVVAPTREITPMEPSPAGVLQMLQQAMEKGHDPDTMGKFMDLYERMEANAAKKAFNAAMLGFQNACPVIRKNKTAGAGSYSFEYASLDYVASVVAPHLQKHGLSYSWENDASSPENTLRTITTIRHVGGHSERFVGPLFPCSTNTKMGPQQAVGSTESYSKRYGLLSALGITSGGEDNDARPPDSKFVTDEQAANLDALIDETKRNREKFLKFAKVDQIGHIPQSEYRKLVKMLESKR